MAVCDRDPLQVADAAPEPADRFEDEACVVLEQGVDEGELACVLDQDGSDVPALGRAEAVGAWSELSQAEASEPTTFQGANGFLTPSSAVVSSGKWRRSSVRIELDSTQSMPSAV